MNVCCFGDPHGGRAPLPPDNVMMTEIDWTSPQVEGACVLVVRRIDLRVRPESKPGEGEVIAMFERLELLTA